MDTKDKKALYKIKHKYRENIKQVSNANAYKYKLKHRAKLILLIKDINRLIKNPIQLLQMNKIYIKFSIQLKYPNPLAFNDK